MFKSKKTVDESLNFHKSFDYDNQILTLKDITPNLTKYWFQYPHLLKLNIYLLSAVFAIITYGYDSSLMGNLQNLPMWESYFHNPLGTMLSTMSNGVCFGAIAAIPFVGFIGDYLGRRPTNIIGCSLVIIGSIIQAAAQNFGMFLAARLILGFGVCFSCAAAGPLLTETAFPSQRPALTSLLQASFPIGSFLAAIFTYGPAVTGMRDHDWSWRLPSLLQAIFPAIELILAIFCPESPRWLVAHGKSEKAFDILTKYHGGGDRDSPLVKFEMAEITAAIDSERVSSQYGWGTWFKSKANMHRLFICCAVPSMMQLCGSSLVSYYFPIVLENIGYTLSIERMKINIGLTVYGLVWSVVAALYSGKLRRKILFNAGFLLMCLMFIIWIILAALSEQQSFKNKAMGRANIAIIYFFYGFYHMTSPIANTYVMEVAPFVSRNQASTLYQFFTNGWILYNNYVNNLGMDLISWRYYIVYCVWLVVQAAIVFFIFPETYGMGLEEIAQIFGEDITPIEHAADNEILGEVVEKPSATHTEDAGTQESFKRDLANTASKKSSPSHKI